MASEHPNAGPPGTPQGDLREFKRLLDAAERSCEQYDNLDAAVDRIRDCQRALDAALAAPAPERPELRTVIEAARPILLDMQQISDAVDDAAGTSDYQTRLVSLGLVARHFLRECGAALAAVRVTPPDHKPTCALLLALRHLGPEDGCTCRR